MIREGINLPSLFSLDTDKFNFTIIKIQLEKLLNSC